MAKPLKKEEILIQTPLGLELMQCPVCYRTVMSQRSDGRLYCVSCTRVMTQEVTAEYYAMISEYNQAKKEPH